MVKNHNDYNQNPSNETIKVIEFGKLLDQHSYNGYNDAWHELTYKEQKNSMYALLSLVKKYRFDN